MNKKWLGHSVAKLEDIPVHILATSPLLLKFDSIEILWLDQKWFILLAETVLVAEN